jgi:hypothetical protein
MNLVLTMLTFFLGGEPTAAVVPEPAVTAGAITVQGEFETRTLAGDHLGLPRIAPPPRHLSPSWMVAAPPVPSAPFDVFSPAVRPPHEFPGLFPCGPAALVPCPPPLPASEPPAVRHVSFLGDGAEYRVADREPSPAYGSPHLPHPFPVPHPMAFVPPGFGPDPLFQLMWEQAHAHRHAREQHHQTVACEEAQSCPPAFHGSVCPVGLTCPVGRGPFPGAKNVQHVVRATYEVGPQVAEALSSFLESSDGVFGYQIDGDEVTINATAPAQMAIATFLSTVVSRSQNSDRPAKMINVKQSQPKACTSECAANKCCNGECDCKDKCNCCCNKKTKPDLSSVSTSKTCEPCEVRCNVGIPGCEIKIPALSGITSSKESRGLFSFFVGFDRDRNTCPPAKPAPVAVDCQVNESQEERAQIHASSKGVQVIKSNGTRASGDRVELEASHILKLEIQQGSTVIASFRKKSESVRVKIQATSEGVLLQTSDGTEIRAENIHLETGRINQLKLEANPARKQPVSRPVKATPKKDERDPFSRDSAVLNTEPETGYFQLDGPFSTVTESEPQLSGFYFGGVEISR